MCHGGSALLANIIWGGSNLLARVIWGTNNASIINPPGSKNTRIDFPVTPIKGLLLEKTIRLPAACWTSARYCRSLLTVNLC